MLICLDTKMSTEHDTRRTRTEPAPHSPVYMNQVSQTPEVMFDCDRVPRRSLHSDTKVESAVLKGHQIIFKHTNTWKSASLGDYWRIIRLFQPDFIFLLVIFSSLRFAHIKKNLPNEFICSLMVKCVDLFVFDMEIKLLLEHQLEPIKCLLIMTNALLHLLTAKSLFTLHHEFRCSLTVVRCN